MRPLPSDGEYTFSTSQMRPAEVKGAGHFSKGGLAAAFMRRIVP
jgi:hypothetical protein